MSDPYNPHNPQRNQPGYHPSDYHPSDYHPSADHPGAPYQPPAEQSAFQQGPYYVQQETSAMAIISLVSGILSWVALPFLGAIAAVVFGYIARSEIRNSNGRMSGDGMALAGIILGGAQLALTLLAVCGFLLFLFLVVIIGIGASAGAV